MLVVNHIFLVIFVIIFSIEIFQNRRKPLSFEFITVFSWGLHYVLGGLLLLFSIDTFLWFIPEEERGVWYLNAQLYGFLFLLGFKMCYKRMKGNKHLFSEIAYSSKDGILIICFCVLAAFFGVLFIGRISVEQYFQTDLALYRARLGDYVGKGIGYYYYPMVLMVPGVLLLITYFIQRKTIWSAALALAYLALFSIVVVPLGGRGRFLNVVLVSWLVWAFRSIRFRVLSWGKVTVMIFLVLSGIGLGHVRGYLISGDGGTISWSSALSAMRFDLSRIDFQSYIYSKYGIGGHSLGKGYVEGVLGPFAGLLAMVPENGGMIRDLSREWHYDSIGAEIESAISPGFIGELYINFGLIGASLSGIIFAVLLNSVQRSMNLKSSLERAFLGYFGIFTAFHGGLYALFSILWIYWPIWLINRLAGARGRRRSRSDYDRSHYTYTVPASKRVIRAGL
jgi:hypothetical protein